MSTRVKGSAALRRALELGFTEEFFDEMCRWVAPADEVTSERIVTRWSPNTRAEALRWCHTLAGLRRMQF